MTPLFFRGSILIVEKVLSYNDFMNMTYSEFKKIEATYSFMTDLKNGMTETKEKTKEEVKDKLSGLPTVHIADLDLPEIYKEIFTDGNS